MKIVIDKYEFTPEEAKKVYKELSKIYGEKKKVKKKIEYIPFYPYYPYFSTDNIIFSSEELPKCGTVATSGNNDSFSADTIFYISG